MTSTNVVQFSAASRKRDRDHIAGEQEENHVIHDGGGGPPPIVVNIALRLPDDVVKETKDQETNRRIRRSFGEWLLILCTFWLGFSLFS